MPQGVPFLFVWGQTVIFNAGVPLRVRLYAHTAPALTTRPVSAAILNAGWFISSPVHLFISAIVRYRYTDTNEQMTNEPMNYAGGEIVRNFRGPLASSFRL